MLLVVYVCSFLVKSTIGFHQNDYTIVHHRVELINYNHKFVRNVKANMVPLNRTIRGLNVSFDLLTDLSEDISMVFRVFKLSMNAYRNFPAFLNVSYCKMRRENLFGINDLAEHSNISVCPLKKGHYYINKYRPDETKFPPRFLAGDFKISVQFTSLLDSIAEAHWYGAVKTIEILGKWK